MVALDEAGEPVRDALLWNDTRSAPEARALVEELGGPQACADGARAACWSRRSPSPSCAGCATTSPTKRSGSPRCCSRTTTSRATCRLPAPRPSPTAATPPAPATSRRARAPGAPTCAKAALGHDAAAAARRTLPVTLPAHRGRRRAAPARATTWGPRSGWVSSPATCSSRSARRASRRRSAGNPSPTAPAWSPASPTPRGGFLPMVTTMNAAGILDLQAALARRRPRRAGRRSPWQSPPGARRGHAAALLRRRAHPQPPGRGRHLDRPDPAHHPRRPRAGRVRGAAVLARRRRRRPGQRDRQQPQRVLLVGGAARSAAVRALAPAILGRAVVLPRRGRVRRPRRRPAGGLGALRRRRSLRTGHCPTTGTLDGRPDPRRPRALRRAS